MAGGNKLPILAGVLVLAGLAGFFVLGPKPKPPAEPVLTAEAKSYLGNLGLSDVSMQAADSVAKVSLLEITGKISNKGSRAVEVVQITCFFHQPNGQVVQRDRVMVVGPRTGPLEPGATKPFRLNFDNVPDTWNQTMPDLVIAQIRFR
ncbi:MAG: FxLYD domain-containing protein [Acidobacteriota bacterium]|nr:FxLYD domain-containing protein [Acidobacteriota bacterium]